MELSSDLAWARRDEYIRHGIPLAVYRRQVEIAQRLHAQAFGQILGALLSAIRRRLG